MSTNIDLQIKKKEFDSSVDSEAGMLVFDKTTHTIYVGGELYSSTVKSATYDSTTKVLTITMVDGSTIQLNLKDDTSANNPSGLLATLRDDINANKLSIATLNGTGTGSVSKAVSDAIGGLSSTIVTVSESNDIVTIKKSITESDGIIDNSTSEEVSLSKVAKTGSAGDVTVTYDSASTNMQSAVSDIDSRITSLSTRQVQYIEPTSNDTTPSGYNHYYASGSAYTGTLTASADTMNKIYLCKTTSYTGDYHQIMTVQSGSSYKWVDISATTIDLSGYVKSLTINGKTYTPSTSGDISLGDVVNVVSGETEVAGWDDDFVSVSTSDSTSLNGVKTVSITSKVKVQDIDTATDSNNGLATAKSVQDYVGENLTTIKYWSEEDIPS